MDVSGDLQELERLRPDAVLPVEKVEEKKYRVLLEPALVGAMMAINLGQTSLQNFYLETACKIDLGYEPYLCEGTMNATVEANSQKIISGINISRSFVGCLISTFVLLFVGPWSDYSGRRKPLLIISLLGMSIMSTGILYMITFPGATAIQVLYTVQIPISIGGNFGLLLAAAFSYIGDVCHSTGRDVTRTMGTHRAAIQIAHVAGSICGPLLFHRFGYYGVFPIVLLLQLSSLVYIIWVVEDVNVNSDNKVHFLNWRLPFNAIHCLVKPREGKRRMIILLMMIVALGDRVLLSAEVLLYYMYTRYKFGWNDILFGAFLAYRNIISFCGTLLILTVLKKRLKLSDEMVGSLSCLSYILASSGLIAAQTTVVVFLVPIIGIIAQGSQVVQRPILNRQILPTEQGKIYSVMGALESATQVFSSPLYSLLYKKTVSTMPDAWLIPGIILASIQSLAYLITKLNSTDKKEITANKHIVNDMTPIVKNIPLDVAQNLKLEGVNEKEVLRKTGNSLSNTNIHVEENKLLQQIDYKSKEAKNSNDKINNGQSKIREITSSGTYEKVTAVKE